MKIIGGVVDFVIHVDLAPDITIIPSRVMKTNHVLVEIEHLHHRSESS